MMETAKKTGKGRITPPLILLISILLLTAFVIIEITGNTHNITKLFSGGEDKLLEAIRNPADSSGIRFLYNTLDTSHRRSIAAELLQHKIEHPAYINESIMTILFLLLSFGIVYYYYNRKHRDIENFFRTDPLFDKDKKDGFPYIYKTVEDLDKSMLKYNLIGSCALILTFTIVLVLTLFIFDLFKGTVKSISDLGGQNLVLGVLLIVLRTSLLGSFILLFVVHMIKFTRSSFDQAVRFNKRKHATLFLLQLFKQNKENNLAVTEIMQAFKEWNVTVDSAFTDSQFDKAVAKNAYALLGKLVEQTGKPSQGPSGS